MSGASREKHSQWRERLERFAQSELSVVEFCRLESVSEPSFYQWRKKLAGSSSNAVSRRTPTRSSFVPVQVAPTSELQVSFPNGVRLTVPGSDHDLTSMLINAIAQARTTRDAEGEA